MTKDLGSSKSYKAREPTYAFSDENKICKYKLIIFRALQRISFRNLKINVYG